MRLSYVLRFALGILFIYASIDKIRFPDKFLRILYNYHLLPDAVLTPVAIILPWLECLVGISLITGIFLEGGIIWANLLLIIFFLALLIDFLRGLNINCGCFNLDQNPTAQHNMLWYLLRDLFLLLIALYIGWDLLKEKRRGLGNESPYNRKHRNAGK